MSSVDFSKLVAYAGANERKLLLLAMNSNEAFQKFNVVAGVKTKYTAVGIEFESLIKPFAKSWSPDENKVALVPRTGTVETLQIELEETPENYRKTYLGEMLKNPSQSPFEEYMLEGISKKIAQDINNNLVMFGDYSLRESTDPTIAKSPKAINDGFITVINKEITAGNISEAKKNLIPTGDINSTNAVTRLKKFYQKACLYQPALRSTPTKMYISYQTYADYCEHYAALRGGALYNGSYEQKFLEGSVTMCELVPLSSMMNSKRIILGPYTNFSLLVDQTTGEGSAEKIEIWKPNPKVVGYYAQLSFATYIASLKLMWTNEASVDNASGV